MGCTCSSIDKSNDVDLSIIEDSDIVHLIKYNNQISKSYSIDKSRVKTTNNISIQDNNTLAELIIDFTNTQIQLYFPFSHTNNINSELHRNTTITEYYYNGFLFYYDYNETNIKAHHKLALSYSISNTQIKLLLLLQFYSLEKWVSCVDIIDQLKLLPILILINNEQLVNSIISNIKNLFSNNNGSYSGLNNTCLTDICFYSTIEDVLIWLINKGYLNYNNSKYVVILKDFYSIILKSIFNLNNQIDTNTNSNIYIDKILAFISIINKGVCNIKIENNNNNGHSELEENTETNYDNNINDKKLFLYYELLIKELIKLNTSYINNNSNNSIKLSLIDKVIIECIILTESERLLSNKASDYKKDIIDILTNISKNSEINKDKEINIVTNKAEIEKKDLIDEMFLKEIDLNIYKTNTFIHLFNRILNISSISENSNSYINGNDIINTKSLSLFLDYIKLYLSKNECLSTSVKLLQQIFFIYSIEESYNSNNNINININQRHSLYYKYHINSNIYNYLVNNNRSIENRNVLINHLKAKYINNKNYLMTPIEELKLNHDKKIILKSVNSKEYKYSNNFSILTLDNNLPLLATIGMNSNVNDNSEIKDNKSQIKIYLIIFSLLSNNSIYQSIDITSKVIAISNNKERLVNDFCIKHYKDILGISCNTVIDYIFIQYKSSITIYSSNIETMKFEYISIVKNNSHIIEYFALPDTSFSSTNLFCFSYNNDLSDDDKKRNKSIINVFQLSKSNAESSEKKRQSYITTLLLSELDSKNNEIDNGNNSKINNNFTGIKTSSSSSNSNNYKSLSLKYTINSPLKNSKEEVIIKFIQPYYSYRYNKSYLIGSYNHIISLIDSNNGDTIKSYSRGLEFEGNYRNALVLEKSNNIEYLYASTNIEELHIYEFDSQLPIKRISVFGEFDYNIFYYNEECYLGYHENGNVITCFYINDDYRKDNVNVCGVCGVDAIDNEEYMKISKLGYYFDIGKDIKYKGSLVIKMLRDSSKDVIIKNNNDTEYLFELFELGN